MEVLGIFKPNGMIANIFGQTMKEVQNTTVGILMLLEMKYSREFQNFLMNL